MKAKTKGGPKMRIAYLAILAVALPFAAVAQSMPSGQAIDSEVAKVMASTHAQGMGIALIDHGQVKYLQAYGVRDAKGDPLQTNTVMYGASLTKAVFAYNVMQLVDQGKLKLDTPIADDLDQPLPSYGSDPAIVKKYGRYQDLADDPRWKKITPRMCLTHSTGFNNFWFMEPDFKLHIHFDPGTRFSYSGEGIVLLQFVIEHGRTSQGLGVDVGDLMDANFKRLGMTRTSVVFRPDLASDLADGWNDQGKVVEHNRSGRVRAAGSMDTTISDFSKFAAALVRGDGLSAAARAEMVRPQVHITVPHQFPVLSAELPPPQQRKDLYAGLGVVVFRGPQGSGFFKGGHDDHTANTMLCVEKGQRCAVILSNDVRAEAGFAELVRFLLGETGVPYDWEYGDYAGKS
jgi:CubicO group peptidase (beta-lactamase class C family)